MNIIYSDKRPVMRLNTAFRLMSIATVASRSVTSFVPPPAVMMARSDTMNAQTSVAFLRPTTDMMTSDPAKSSKRFMTSTGSNEAELKHIGWEEMDAIIDEYEELGREKTGILVLDVRNEDEIAYTGQLSPNTKTLPLPFIMQYNIFSMSEDEFEDICGFPKPTLDETIVFSCAAGIRSVHAAKFAAAAGYSKLVNYAGGANEWFTR